MMKMVALPDIHGGMKHQLSRFGDVLSKCDVVLLPGDMTNNGNREVIAHILDTIREYCGQVLAIPGNWDFEPVISYLNEQKINLHASHKIVDGIAFVGIGGSLPFIGGNQYTEADFEKIIKTIEKTLPNDVPMILVSHQPPYNTINDRTGRGEYVGSHTIRAFIEKHQPLICFTGHIHEGIGIDTIGKTQVINPGPAYSGVYAYAEVVAGEVIALDSYKV